MGLLNNKITFCEAIAKKEGWLLENSRARRNHNPGNINWGMFALLHGATKIEAPLSPQEKPRFAVFRDAQTGFSAMSSLLEAHYAGLTVRQAIYKWAPPTDNNDSEKYCQDVCNWTGLTPDTVLTDTLLRPPLLVSGGEIEGVKA